MHLKLIKLQITLELSRSEQNYRTPQLREVDDLHYMMIHVLQITCCYKQRYCDTEKTRGYYWPSLQLMIIAENDAFIGKTYMN